MRILFVAGGTAGPLTPLLAVAESIKRTDTDADLRFIIAPNDAERSLCRQAGVSYQEFRSGKLRRYFSVRNITDVLLVAIAFFRARGILQKMKPSCVVSAGSYNAVPLLWAARVLGIPFVVHQQDLRPGLANRLTWKGAATVTVAFQEAAKRFASHPNVVCIGNPVRKTLFAGSKERAQRELGLPTEKPVVLLLGGSSGAKFLNELARAVAHALDNEATLVHVYGKNVLTAPKKEENYFPVQFLPNPADIFALADVVVCRAGIGTLGELAVLGKTVVVIPMPGTHQEANAQYFEKQNAALVLGQDNLDAKKLATALQTLLRDGTKRQEFSVNIQKLNPKNAADRLAAEIQKIASGHGH